MEFYFFALAAQGSGISGGDKIFIEFARRWSKKFPVTVFLSKEGYKMCVRQGLNSKLKTKNSKLSFKIYNIEKWQKLGFLTEYIARIIQGITLGVTLNLSTSYKLQATYIYSASEFWMDSLPCLILKLRYPKIKWVAAWYQTAPNPLKGFSEGRYKLSAFYYWLMQKPIKPLISRFADFVLVNNETEKVQFPRLNRNKKVIVVLGAVPLEDIKRFLATNYKLLATKKYDAVFQGRFHPQKGVVELIDIWKKVVEKKPDVKLVMIGDGPLMENVKSQISNYQLQNNVELFGFLFDGDKKYKIFAQSKVVVHPAFYDSGGMASAEAMAFGLPCVGFDLPSYKSYYPQGMVKVKIGDKKAFASQIMKLLEGKDYYKKVTKEAIEIIESNWSWNIRAQQVLLKIIK